MTRYTDQILRHHAELRRKLRGYLRKARRGLAREDAKALVSFLRNELLPHAGGEERAFYPVLDEVIRSHGQPTRIMARDHERILEYVSRLSRAAGRGPRAPGAASGSPRPEFDRLALELGAILELHFDKENQEFLPLFDRYVDPMTQGEVLARMHEEPAPKPRARPALPGRGQVGSGNPRGPRRYPGYSGRGSP